MASANPATSPVASAAGVVRHREDGAGRAQGDHNVAHAGARRPVPAAALSPAPGADQAPAGCLAGCFQRAHDDGQDRDVAKGCVSRTSGRYSSAAASRSSPSRKRPTGPCARAPSARRAASGSVPGQPPGQPVVRAGRRRRPWRRSPVRFRPASAAWSASARQPGRFRWPVPSSGRRRRHRRRRLR